MNASLSASPSSSPRLTPVVKLVDAARRRWLVVTLAEELAWPAIVFSSALILSLLFGTDAFSLWLAIAATSMAIAVSAWRLRNRIPTHYSAAQIVDREFRLHDSVSTAYFLLMQPDGTPPHPSTSRQLEQANALANTVEPAKAFPLRSQRPWLIAAGLGLIAITLFTTRFLVTHSLALRPPLVALHFDTLIETAERALGTNETPDLKTRNNQARREARPSNNQSRQQQASNAELPPPLPAPLRNDANGSSDSSSPSASPGTKTAGGASPDKSSPNDPSAKKSSGENGRDSNSPSEPRGDPQSEAKNQGQSPASKDTSGAAPGLMSRLKEALSSMVAKMSPQQNGGQKTGSSNGKQDGKSNTSDQPSKSGEQSASKQGENGQDKTSSEDSSNGQGDSQTAEKAGSSQSKSSSSSPNNGSDSQSGVGRQDGAKDLRDAEQQQAMGKLAEILGKRSAQLTGDMTVESPSGNQQLKTEYTHQQGRHADTGGEINRNEVPPRYRQYVQDYMEQIRRAR